VKNSRYTVDELAEFSGDDEIAADLKAAAEKLIAA
jgi:hypothetical protein